MGSFIYVTNDPKNNYRMLHGQRSRGYWVKVDSEGKKHRVGLGNRVLGSNGDYYLYNSNGSITRLTNNGLLTDTLKKLNLTDEDLHYMSGSGIWNSTNGWGNGTRYGKDANERRIAENMLKKSKLHHQELVNADWLEKLKYVTGLSDKYADADSGGAMSRLAESFGDSRGNHLYLDTAWDLGKYMIPIAGNVMSAYDAYKDFKQGNIGSGLLGVGFALMPGFNHGAVKALSKLGARVIKGRAAVPRVANAVDRGFNYWNKYVTPDALISNGVKKIAPKVIKNSKVGQAVGKGTRWVAHKTLSVGMPLNMLASPSFQLSDTVQLYKDRMNKFNKAYDADYKKYTSGKLSMDDMALRYGMNGSRKEIEDLYTNKYRADLRAGNALALDSYKKDVNNLDTTDLNSKYRFSGSVSNYKKILDKLNEFNDRTHKRMFDFAGYNDTTGSDLYDKGVNGFWSASANRLSDVWDDLKHSVNYYD